MIYALTLYALSFTALPAEPMSVDPVLVEVQHGIPWRGCFYWCAACECNGSPDPWCFEDCLENNSDCPNVCDE